LNSMKNGSLYENRDLDVIKTKNHGSFYAK
jgi:hypothetical protein